MNAVSNLIEAIALLWDKFPDLLGDDWLSFRNRLWILLRKLEDEKIDKSKVTIDIRELFEEHAEANQALIRIEQKMPPEGSKSISRSVENSRYVVVPIFYATDRKVTGNPNPSKFYSGERGSGELSYGMAEVSIPDDHRMGELESPSFWRLEFRQSPEKHVVLLKVESLRTATFNDKVRSQIDAASTADVLIFMHGYNVSFENAARRTAQIAKDLNFEGVPMLYSWPSEASVHKYSVDAGNIKWTTPHFHSFLKRTLTEFNAQTVHVIAHSMGNRALADTIRVFDPSSLPGNAAELRNIVFAAPDIDAQTFKDLAKLFPGRAEQFTLYASSKDMALDVSEIVYKYPRAGDSEDGLIVIDEVDTIDASAVDASLMGHSYVGDNRSVLADLFAMIKHGHPPDERAGLEAVTHPDGRYWRFKA